MSDPMYLRGHKESTQDDNEDRMQVSHLGAMANQEKVKEEERRNGEETCRKKDDEQHNKRDDNICERRRKSHEGKHDGARRSSLGRPQIKIPYLAQIERRLSMDLLDYSGKLEGLKLIREVNRETSHYRHLAVALGGSSDCEQLREDLKRTRQRAADLVSQAKAKLLPCLQEPSRFSSFDRKEARRLCKLLFYCIRVLEQELTRTSALQTSFTLVSGNPSLIKTGVIEYPTSHKNSPPAHNADQSTKDRILTEKNYILALQKDACELRSYLHKSDGSPSVKSWTMEDFGERQFLHTIIEDSDPSSVSSPATPYPNLETGDQESLDESLREKLRHRRCLCWTSVVLLTTLLFASLLGTLIAFLVT